MTITIHTDAGDFLVEPKFGLLLTEITERAGVQLNTRCGGKGSCSGCVVKLEAGDYIINEERITLAPGEYRTALSCQCQVVSEEVQVSYPQTSLVEKHAKILEDFVVGEVTHEPRSRKFYLKLPRVELGKTRSDWEDVRNAIKDQPGFARVSASTGVLRLLPEVLAERQRNLTVTLGRIGSRWSVVDFEPGNTTDQHYGVAIDIGTTTVVALLADLTRATVIRKAAMYNQQISKADDVASRISYCMAENAVGELQNLVIARTINPLIDTLCEEAGIQARDISRIAVSANTVMSHLFLGLSPVSIGRLPFQPVTRVFGAHRGAELKLHMNPHGIVDVVPAIAGYVGGDVVSDIYVANINKQPELTLMVDLGTNGELVLSEGSQMLTCATAAGPAFEGYGLQHGCRAATGAIEGLHFDASLELELRVIDKVPPTGICGSGIIDFLAIGLRCGLINQMGRYDIDLLKASNRYLYNETDYGNSHACIIATAEESASGEPLFVSELDISQVLKAKAATYAGMKTLVESQGKTFKDVKHFCLAGGFARHIDLRNAICMGLLPELPLDRFRVIGNGSLAGAYLALVEADAMERFEDIINLPRVIELNLIKDFEGHFIDALGMPNICETDFPSVMAELNTA